MVLALGMPEHIPNTQGREIARTAEYKYRSAPGVDESRLEFWLPHLSGLYNDEVPSTIEGNYSRVNFPASQCGVGPGKRGAFNRSMQHHLTVVLKGGVYARTETNETFSQGEERHLGSLEGGAVHACDWARLWQATSHHSQAVVATWGHRSPCASSLAASPYPR